MAFCLDFAFWCVLGAAARYAACRAALRHVARGRWGRRGACGAAPGAFFVDMVLSAVTFPLSAHGAAGRSAGQQRQAQVRASLWAVLWVWAYLIARYGRRFKQL